jgi:hypothetical protein
MSPVWFPTNNRFKRGPRIDTSCQYLLHTSGAAGKAGFPLDRDDIPAGSRPLQLAGEYQRSTGFHTRPATFPALGPTRLPDAAST